MATPKKKHSKEELDKCRVLTPEFRVAFPHVFKPQAPKGSDKLKYSVTMMFKKSDDLTSIKNAIKNAKILTYGTKDNWPDDIESPVTDGDLPKHANKEGYPGCWIINASANEDRKPGVVDQDVEPIIEPSAFYPGCYARAYVYAYCWEYMGRHGVSLILDHVQKTREGKAIGGKKQATEVFTPVNSSAAEEVDEDLETETW